MSTEALQSFLYPVTVEGPVQLRLALRECATYEGLSADRKAIIFVDFHRGPTTRGVIEIAPEKVTYFSEHGTIPEGIECEVNTDIDAPQNNYAEYRYKILSDKIKDAPLNSPARQLLEIEKEYLDIWRYTPENVPESFRQLQELERDSVGREYVGYQLIKIEELKERFLAIAQQAKSDEWVKYIVGHSDLLDVRESLQGISAHVIPIAPSRRDMIDVYRSEPNKDAVIVLEQLIGIGKKYHFNPFEIDAEHDTYEIRKLAEENPKAKVAFLQRHPHFLERNPGYSEYFPERPKVSPKVSARKTPSPEPEALIPVETSRSAPPKRTIRVNFLRSLNLDPATEVGSKNVRYGIGTLIAIGVFVAVSVGLLPVLGPASFGVGFGAAVLFIVAYTWANKLYEKRKAKKQRRASRDEPTFQKPKPKRRKSNSLKKVVVLEARDAVPLEPASAQQKDSKNRQEYIVLYQGIRHRFKDSGAAESLVLLNALVQKIKLDYVKQYNKRPGHLDIIAALHEIIESVEIHYIDFRIAAECLALPEAEDAEFGAAPGSLDTVTDNILKFALRKVTDESHENKEALKAYIDKQTDPYYKLYFLEKLLSQHPKPDIMRIARSLFASVLENLDPKDPVIVKFAQQQALVVFSQHPQSAAVDRFMVGVRNIPMEIVIAYILQNPDTASAFFNDSEFKLKFANIEENDYLSRLVGKVQIRNALQNSAVMDTHSGEAIESRLEQEFRKTLNVVCSYGNNSIYGLQQVFERAFFRDELLNYITLDNVSWIQTLLIEKSSIQFKYFLLGSGFLERLDQSNPLKEILLGALKKAIETQGKDLKYTVYPVKEAPVDVVSANPGKEMGYEEFASAIGNILQPDVVLHNKDTAEAEGVRTRKGL